MIPLSMLISSRYTISYLVCTAMSIPIDDAATRWKAKRVIRSSTNLPVPSSVSLSFSYVFGSAKAQNDPAKAVEDDQNQSKAQSFAKRFCKLSALDYL